MSDNQPVIELLEDGDYSRVSAANNVANETNSSLSSRSTLIKEILTSEQSKKLVDDIDKKIVSLVNIIKEKRYSERRKKYYTKKILNRIVENKFPDETTLNTDAFNRYSLPTSTPYDNEKEKNVVEKSKSTSNKGAGDLQDKFKYNPPDCGVDNDLDLFKKSNSLIKSSSNNLKEAQKISQNRIRYDKVQEKFILIKSPDLSEHAISTNNSQDLDIKEPNQVDSVSKKASDLIKITPKDSSCGLSSSSKDDERKEIRSSSNSKVICTDYCFPSTSKEHDILERLKFFDKHFLQDKNDFSPRHLEHATKETDTIITKIEKNVAEVKNSLSNNKIKGNEILNDLLQAERLGDNQEKCKQKEEISSNNEVNSCSDNKQYTSKNDSSLTIRYQNMVENNEPKKPEFNTFKNLTPRTLCEVYKIQFNDTSSSNKATSTSSTENQLENSSSRSKDWKYYKTTSEKIFENNQKAIKVPQKKDKDFLIKYAKKEKDRQILWINNEIKCLTKLKRLLEEHSIDSNTQSVASTSSTQYKFASHVVDSDTSNSAGTKTLKEINECLDELRRILNNKKSKKTIKSSLTNLDAYSHKLDKNSSKNSYSSPVTDTPIKELINAGNNKEKNVSTSVESSTSYKKISKPKIEVINCYPKNVKKPTEFEVKYFQENTISSHTSFESNKENLNFSDLEINSLHLDVAFTKNIKNCTMRSIEVQTSFRNSPSSSNNDKPKEINENGQISVHTIFPLDEQNGDANRRSVRKSSSSSCNLKSKSTAYFLTFEEVRNGVAENDIQKSKTLEKVTVKIPSIAKSKATVKNENLELQECLSKHKSDFIRSAEWRRQCINELMYMRDKKQEDTNRKLLFTVKEMKNITKKKYDKTEEVQHKLQMKKSQLQRVFNRQLASMFSKKLQEKTLKGQVTISTSKTVVYS